MVKPKKFKPYPAWRFSLNGNEFFIDAFRDFVLQNGCKKEGHKAPHYGIYKISWGGIKPPKQIAFLLYSNARIYLERKMELARDLINYESRRIKNCSCSYE